MDAFLAELRARGEFDSSGRFTSDHERALEVFRRHRLARPEQAVLHVVRAAVAGGSAWLRAQVESPECELEFPGSLMPAEEFSRLLAWLLEPERNRAGFHLALACNAALADSQVELTHWDGLACARLRAGPDRALTVEIGREPPWREPRTRVRFRALGPASPWAGLSRAPQAELLRNRCRYAPLRLTLNGQELPALDLGRGPELRLFAAGPASGIRLGPSRSRALQCCTVNTLPLPSVEYAVEGSGPTLIGALTRGSGELVLVSEGVQVEKPLSLRRGAGVVSLAGWGLDLTGEGPRWDQCSLLQERLETYGVRLG